MLQISIGNLGFNIPTQQLFKGPHLITMASASDPPDLTFEQALAEVNQSAEAALKMRTNIHDFHQESYNRLSQQEQKGMAADIDLYLNGLVSHIQDNHTAWGYLKTLCAGYKPAVIGQLYTIYWVFEPGTPRYHKATVVKSNL
jgi:hypothetical protein